MTSPPPRPPIHFIDESCGIAPMFVCRRCGCGRLRLPPACRMCFDRHHATVVFPRSSDESWNDAALAAGAMPFSTCERRTRVIARMMRWCAAPIRDRSPGRLALRLDRRYRRHSSSSAQRRALPGEVVPDPRRTRPRQPSSVRYAPRTSGVSTRPRPSAARCEWRSSAPAACSGHGPQRPRIDTVVSVAIAWLLPRFRHGALNPALRRTL